MARLKADVFGCSNADVYPRTFKAGDECPEELEAAAIDAGALETAEEAEAREKADAVADKASTKASA